jgi:hypothetical protein
MEWVIERFARTLVKGVSRQRNVLIWSALLYENGLMLEERHESLNFDGSVRLPSVGVRPLL